MSTDATKEGLHFDQIHRSRRHKAFRLRDHFRGQERGGRDPAGHAARQRPLPDRKRTGYFRRSSAAGDPARYGRGDPALRPQHARDRLHPCPQRDRAHRACPPYPRVVLSHRRRAWPLRPCPCRHAGRLQLRRPPHRPAHQGLRGHGRHGRAGRRLCLRRRPEGRAARRPHLSRYCLRWRDDEHPACGSFVQRHDDHRKLRQGAAHRRPRELPERHGRADLRRGHRRHQGARRQGAARRLLFHHPRPDRGGHVYGRCRRSRRRRAD